MICCVLACLDRTKYLKTTEDVYIEHRLILEFVLKLQKMPFYKKSLQNIFNCQAYLFETISVYESSMSLSLNSIGQFPNIALKIRKQKVLPHWCVR